MKILAFAASNSIKSINKQLVIFASKQLESHDVEVIDINDFELPIYSIDLETKFGIPAAVHAFREKIAQADGMIISFAEHNGGYTVAYKNLFDWASRVNMGVYQGTPTVMLSTSPGGGGASNVLSTAVNSAKYFEGNVVASMSLPSFYENFNLEAGEVTDEALKEKLKATVLALTA